MKQIGNLLRVNWDDNQAANLTLHADVQSLLKIFMKSTLLINPLINRRWKLGEFSHS